MAMHAAGARAADPEAPMYSFSGFGTLGVAHSTEGRADYTLTGLQPNGAGYTHAWSPDVDSRLGAQVIADFMPQISAVVQILLEQRYDKSYAPTVEWANFKYPFTPDASVRAWRTVLPVFLVSDYR